MDQIMLAAVCRIIVGRYGRRIAAYSDIRSAYTNGLFADYYRFNPLVSVKTYFKYAGAKTPYPHFLERHYGGPKGYLRTLGDMTSICDVCTSIVLLHQIQDELHHWVSVHLPPDEVRLLDTHYVGSESDRREIAVYLADTMHHAICRIPSDIHQSMSVLD